MNSGLEKSESKMKNAELARFNRGSSKLRGSGYTTRPLELQKQINRRKNKAARASRKLNRK